MILVNVGRGDLVNDEDLIQALQDRRILAAGLDVFDNEPSINPAYLDLPNAFLLPHTGSSTWETRTAMNDALIEAMTTYEAGRRSTAARHLQFTRCSVKQSSIEDK